MEPRDWTVGARVEHPVHGPGTVTSVGTDYLGIAFDASGEALIRREAFKQPAEAPEVTEPMPFHREILAPALPPRRSCATSAPRPFR